MLDDEVINYRQKEIGRSREGGRGERDAGKFDVEDVAEYCLCSSVVN